MGVGLPLTYKISCIRVITIPFKKLRMYLATAFSVLFFHFLL